MNEKKGNKFFPAGLMKKVPPGAFSAKGLPLPAFFFILFSVQLCLNNLHPALAKIPLPEPLQSRNSIPKEKVDINISAVGDIIMHLPVKKAARDAGGYDTLFDRNFKKIFQESDIAFANLETVIRDKDHENLDWPGFFYADEKFLATLEKNGINILNLANNHILDYGNEGFHKTLRNIKKFKGLTAIGYSSHPRRKAGIIKKIKGINIGFLAFTTLLNLPHSVEIEYPRLNYIQNEGDIVQMLESVADLSSRTDLLVVSMHWGDEYSREVNPYVLFLARKLAEAGADIIIGHHSHILQRVALINKKNPYVPSKAIKQTLIFFSMGNFISNQGRTEDEVQLRESAVFQIRVRMEKYPNPQGRPFWNKKFSWTYVPLWTKNILGDIRGEHLYKFGEQLHLIKLVSLQCEYLEIHGEIKEFLSQKTASWDREKAHYHLQALINLKKRLNSIESILGKNHLGENQCR